MVSPDAISSGEAVPMMLTKTGRGAVVSWYGTDGAFGINGLQAIMPLDVYVLFPAGASLDENYTIQLDSNASLSGGVAPTVRVPLDRDTVARAMAGEDVQLAYATEWLDGQRGFNASAGSPVNATTSQTQTAGGSPVQAVAALGIIGIAGALWCRK